jgi:AraC-like DNA-binding protein
MPSSSNPSLNTPPLNAGNDPGFAAVVLGALEQMTVSPVTDMESKGLERRWINDFDVGRCPYAGGQVSAAPPSHLSSGAVIGDLLAKSLPDEGLARWFVELTVRATLKLRHEDCGPISFDISDIHAGKSGSPPQTASSDSSRNILGAQEANVVVMPAARTPMDRSRIAAEILGELKCEGQALVFLIHFLRRPDESALPSMGRAGPGLPRWRLKRACSYIKAHLEGPIPLGALAGAAGLSPTYFAAQFKAATGLRPHEYVMRRRIEVAQQRLLDPRLTIIEIAIGVGFQSQAHFTTSFKRIVGQAPGRWRKENYVDR